MNFYYISLLNKLPYEIIINHIIPYTYNKQKEDLLVDIVNNYETLNKINNNTQSIHNILYSIYWQNNEYLKNILQRLFIKNHNKLFTLHIFNQYNLKKRFKILWSLLNPIERSKYVKLN